MDNRLSNTAAVALVALGSIALVRTVSYRTAMRIHAARAANTIGKINPSNTIFLLCDVQERFLPRIHNSDTVVQTCRYMTSIAKTMRIPVIATQQYTKAFGPTVPACFATEEELMATPIYEKKRFSMLTETVGAKLATLNDTESFVVMGIEAHVCVQQTCLDLLDQGKEVHLIVDAVSSQQVIDREIALKRLEKAGVYLTTAQSAAFMLLQTADHPNFKEVSKLTVEHMKLKNEFNDELLQKK